MTRRIMILVAVLAVAGALVLGVTGLLDRDVRTPTESLPLVSPPGPGGPGGLVDDGGIDAGGDGSAAPDAPPVGAPPDGSGVAGSGAADGDLDGRTVSVRSDETAVSRLNPELLAALRDAARQASRDGIEVRVSSGWRSREYQQRLLDDAIVKYGSLEEALRWVASPDTSAHITGDAVDVSPTDAAYWMGEHGADFGLCQTYGNEIWHYELLTSPGGTCPAPRADGSS